MQNIFIEFLPPWVETGLQPAFYDKESGTVLQQVSRMYAKMNELIGNVNKFEKDTKDVVDEYIAKFVELYDYVHDYFDNLDVQEEINNKLDEMTEQGILQEIIATYLDSNVTWTFDTVADMKLATNLQAGSYAQTLGFYSANDGGGALYLISDTGTANEFDVIAVGDLYATIVSDRINIRQYGCRGTGTDNDTNAFVNCLNKSIDSGKEIDVPAGTYLLNPNTFQMVTRNTAYNDLTICGISNRKSILKLNNSSDQDYLSNSTSKQVYAELNFYRILFTSKTNTGNMFYCYSTGTEKRFRFYECRFENLSNVLYCAGTGNADLHRFENCAFDIYGSFLTMDNSQSVGIELYGSTFHLNSGAKFLNYLKGGHIDIYGGEIEHFGASTDYVIDNSTQTSSAGAGNYGIHFNGTRFEFHGGRFLNLIAKKVLEVDFTNCNFGTADALTSGNYYSELSDYAFAKFDGCTFTKNLTFHLATSLGNVRAGALLEFTKCTGNDRIYKQVVAEDAYCRVISNGEECLAELGGRGSSDFDWNWQQRSSCPVSARTKTVALKRTGEGTPKAGDNFTFTLPTSPFVLRIKYVRPALTASTASYQLHIGNSDGSVIYAETASDGIFNTAIDLDVKDLGVLEDNVIKVWATGTATNVATVGYAYIEYI